MPLSWVRLKKSEYVFSMVWLDFTLLRALPEPPAAMPFLPLPEKLSELADSLAAPPPVSLIG